MSLYKIILQENLNQIRHFMNDHNIDIVEEKIIGEYELLLVKSDMYPITPYSIGFQKTGRNFTSFTDQLTKVIPENIDYKSLALVIKTIIDWVKQYKKIIIGSYNSRNTEVYKKIFKRYNLKVTEVNMFNTTLLLIE